MRIVSSYKLHCERKQIWEVLMDIDVLSNIISRSTSLRKTGENRYEGRLKVKLGPIDEKVTTTLELSNISKPNSFRLRLTSKLFKGDGEFRLKQRKKDNVSAIYYEGDINRRGMLKLIPRSKVKKHLNRKLTKLFKKIEAQCCKENGNAH